MFGPYAGFWRRFFAALIDAIILSFISILIAHLFDLPSFRFSVFTQPIGRVGGVGRIRLVGVATGWLYFALLETSPARGTIGKLVLGVSVARVDGGRASFLRTTVRYFAKYLSAFILGIGFLMAAFTRRKQALHDMIAGCVVVKGAR